MGTTPPITIQQTLYRGVVAYRLKWVEEGVEREQHFESEAEAVMEIDAIEERLRVAAMAGQGLTVNPFGMKMPFISSKDVHFASLKLQPRGLKFRESVEEYVAAVNALEGTGSSVRAAALAVAELGHALKPYDVSLHQAVFEWLEMKRQLGDVPLYEVVREYMKLAARNADSPPEGSGNES